jgi:hypothetical protein
MVTRGGTYGHQLKQPDSECTTVPHTHLGLDVGTDGAQELTQRDADCRVAPGRWGAEEEEVADGLHQGAPQHGHTVEGCVAQVSPRVGTMVPARRSNSDIPLPT